MMMMFMTHQFGLNLLFKLLYLLMNLELVFSFLALVRSLVILHPNLCSLSLTNCLCVFHINIIHDFYVEIFLLYLYIILLNLNICLIFCALKNLRWQNNLGDSDGAQQHNQANLHCTDIQLRQPCLYAPYLFTIVTIIRRLNSSYSHLLLSWIVVLDQPYCGDSSGLQEEEEESWPNSLPGWQAGDSQ